MEDATKLDLEVDIYVRLCILSYQVHYCVYPGLSLLLLSSFYFSFCFSFSFSFSFPSRSSVCLFHLLPLQTRGTRDLHDLSAYSSFLSLLCSPVPGMMTSTSSSNCLGAEGLFPFSRSAAQRAAPTMLVTVISFVQSKATFSLQVKMMETTGTRPRTMEMVPNLLVSGDRYR